jgi:cellulose synthase/poly-beta-1,6-N-acetylglucosamine synthase-like glycosyltransferase
MPKISAIVHARDDAHRLGRTLETLRPCDEIIVIDHEPEKENAKVSRQYGAKVHKAIVGVEDGTYAVDTRHEWVLCLRPDETLSEALEATLFEWKNSDPGNVPGYALGIREQKRGNWRQLTPEVRLVNRTKLNWKTELPPNNPGALKLEGDLLRFPDN